MHGPYCNHFFHHGADGNGDCRQQEHDNDGQVGVNQTPLRHEHAQHQEISLSKVESTGSNEKDVVAGCYEGIYSADSQAAPEDS